VSVWPNKLLQLTAIPLRGMAAAELRRAWGKRLVAFAPVEALTDFWFLASYGFFMSDLLELGKNILANQPFSVLLGAELTKFEPGKAEITLVVKDKLKQQHGFVHGGVVSYLADNCLTYAGGSVLGDSVTSEYKVNYVRPALGATLVARGEVLSSGKRQAVCQCKVFSADGDEEKLVAVAQGTINKMDPPI